MAAIDMNQEYEKYRQMGWGKNELGAGYNNYLTWLQQRQGQDDLTASDKVNLQNQIDAAKLENENKRIETLKAQGLNADGTPIAPEWSSLLDSNGNLSDKYKISDWSSVTPSTEALNLYKKSALRDAGTNSTWADLMLKKQEQEQAQNIDNSSQQGTQNLLSVMSNLAKSGGLSNAARERQIRNTQMSNLLDKNKIQRQGAIDRTGILTTDEGNRVSGLQNLQNMENTQADILFKNQQAKKTIEEKNLNSLLEEINNKRSWDQNSYKERMSAWAANKTADAQRASAGGGKK